MNLAMAWTWTIALPIGLVKQQKMWAIQIREFNGMK